LTDTTTGFDTGIDSIVTIKNDITKVFSDMTFYFYSTTQYFKYLSIMFILILILTVIVVFGTQFIVCFRMQNKCHSTACLTKGFIAILGVLSLGIAFVLLIFVLLNFTVGGVCDFAFQGTLESGDISGVDQTVPTSVKTLMSADCMKLNGEGKIPEEYITLPDQATKDKFTLVGEYMHGFSTFNNYLKTKENNESENAIKQTEKNWDLYKTGIIYNFDNVEGTLKTLNTNVEGCTEEWVLNSQNCTSVQTGNLCKSVSTTDAFDKARDCITSKQEAQDSFDKMKNYLQGQGIMMNKMILDLTGGQETSPLSNVIFFKKSNKKFKETETKYDSINSDFSVVINSMKNTFQDMSNYKGGYYNITNCMIIRREMLMFSAGVCFGFRPHSQNVFFYLMISKSFFLVNLRLLFTYSCNLVFVCFGKRIIRKNSDCKGRNLFERIPGRGGGCGRTDNSQ
jgi:hypothetical protein